MQLEESNRELSDLNDQIRFAEILKSAMRTIDSVARYGGDEFIVLMPNTDYEGAKTVPYRARSAINVDPIHHSPAAAYP